MAGHEGRLSNPASPRFDAAGARGIAVCADWAGDYGRFLRDMGERPAGTTLERVDPARGFAPGNCAWAVSPSRAARAARGWEKRRAAPTAVSIPAPSPAPKQPGARPPRVVETEPSEPRA